MLEPKTIEEAIKPLLIVNLIFGTGYIDIRQRYLRVLSIFAYVLFYLTCIHVSMIKSVYYLKTYYLFNQNEFGSMVSLALLCSSTGLSLALIVAGTLQSQRLRTITTLINACDTRMENMGLSKRYKTIYLGQLKTLGVFATIALIYILNTYHFQFKSSTPVGIKVFLTVQINLPIMLVTITSLSFCFWMRYSFIKFNQLNSLLRGMLSAASESPQHKKVMATKYCFDTKKFASFKNDLIRAGNGNINTLRAVKHIHLELIKINRIMNNMYGVQILLTMTTSFVFITVLLYEIYRTIWLEPDPYVFIQEIFPLSSWVLFFTLKVFIVNHMSATTSAEAAETGDIICELYEPTSSREFRAEIRDFTLQMIQNPLVYTACGFFDMDHTFIQKVVGSITTYLVILIQVGDIPKPKNSN